MLPQALWKKKNAMLINAEKQCKDHTEGYLPRLPFSEPRNEMLSIHSPADRLQLTPAPAPSQSIKLGILSSTSSLNPHSSVGFRV